MLHRLFIRDTDRQRLNEVFRWYSSRSKKDLKALGLNGCGSKVSGWVVPDLAFREACELHDLLYLMGGTTRDRRLADGAFLDLMLARCRANPQWGFFKKLSLRWSARMYFWAVRFAGGPHFAARRRLEMHELSNLLFRKRL